MARGKCFKFGNELRHPLNHGNNVFQILFNLWIHLFF
ncbi:Uncharacterised protein [Klebsiella pneumoniae]|nr:Uncharacterised protein [Klebsiella pneumoniae]